MKILRRESLYGRNRYIVQLDDDDKNRSDLDMITCCDNHGVYDKSKDKYHFGGHVEPLADGTVRIDVYID